jgi:hypothetical protein
MESRKVPPRLWWKEDGAGADAEMVAVGAEGPSGRRTRRPVISASWRRIGPARRHMVFGWWNSWDGSGSRYGHERSGLVSSALGAGRRHEEELERGRPCEDGGGGGGGEVKGRDAAGIRFLRCFRSQVRL